MPPIPQNRLEQCVRDLISFSYLSLGDFERAGQVAAESYSAAKAKAGDLRDENAWLVWLFHRCNDRLLDSVRLEKSKPQILDEPLKWSEDPASTRLEGAETTEFFQKLPQPSRNAYALFLLEIFTADQLAKVMGLSHEQLALEVENGRRHFVKWREGGGHV